MNKNTIYGIIDDIKDEAENAAKHAGGTISDIQSYRKGFLSALSRCESLVYIYFKNKHEKF